MTDREKLIELISTTDFEPVKGVVRTIGSRFTTSFTEAIADHLIANGVTVQKWIPASEPPKTPGEYIVKIQEGTAATTLYYDVIDHWYELVYGEPVYFHVTHWMPLPKLPKECET